MKAETYFDLSPELQLDVIAIHQCYSFAINLFLELSEDEKRKLEDKIFHSTQELISELTEDDRQAVIEAIEHARSSRKHKLTAKLRNDNERSQNT